MRPGGLTGMNFKVDSCCIDRRVLHGCTANGGATGGSRVENFFLHLVPQLVPWHPPIDFLRWALLGRLAEFSEAPGSSKTSPARGRLIGLMAVYRGLLGS